MQLLNAFRAADLYTHRIGELDSLTSGDQLKIGVGLVTRLLLALSRLES